jgi:PAS domain-containing protein
VENLPIAIFIKEAKELVCSLEQGGRGTRWLLEERMMGKNDYDLFTRTEADAFVVADRQVLASGKLLDITRKLSTRHQGKRVIHTRKIPILDEQNQPFVSPGHHEDITERKRAEEELKRAMEAVEIAVGQGRVSGQHEPRNPDSHERGYRHDQPAAPRPN